MPANFTWPQDGVVLIVCVKGKMWGATINPNFLKDLNEPQTSDVVGADRAHSARILEQYIKPAVNFIEQEIADYRIANAQELLRSSCKKTVAAKVN